MLCRWWRCGDFNFFQAFILVFWRCFSVSGGDFMFSGGDFMFAGGDFLVVAGDGGGGQRWLKVIGS